MPGMSLGTGILLGGRQSLSLGEGVGASLASILFGNGEDGFLFGDFNEPDELLTTFQGPTQVVADSDPVGFAFDDAKWRDRTLAAQTAQATEIISNGTFATNVAGWTAGTGLTASANLGRAEVARSGAINGAAAFYQDFATVAGKTYRLSYDVANANAYPSVYDAPGGVPGTAILAAGAVTTTPGTTGVRYVRAVGTTTRVNFWTDDLSTVYLDNISVKLVDGNHGLQATGGARPLWRSNSGKPYLQFDGSDDNLLTSALPTNLLSFGAKFRTTDVGATKIVLGTSGGGGGGQAWLGTSSSVLTGTIGGVAITGPNVASAVGVAIVTADVANLTLYWQGVQVAQAARLNPMGVTIPFMLGCYNNNGTPSNFNLCNMYGAFEVNRTLSAAEVLSTTNLMGTT